MFGPKLIGPRLQLRPPALADVPVFARWFGDPDIARYWWMREGRGPTRPGVAALRLFLGARLSRNAVLWTIESGGRPIGHCHVRHIDRANGYATAAVLIGEKSQQGKGFAREANALRNEFVFRELRLHKIKASALAKNVATRRLLEGSGYRLVGTAREDALIDGERRDVLLFELLRSDFERAPDLRAGE